MPHLLIASAEFYPDISTALRKGAEVALSQAEATWQTVEVPGALELPVAIAYGMATGRFDGYIALGCVIRGETTHYDTVCAESARGLMMLGIEGGAAIGNGILTVENEAQAWERADPARGDKGGHAARAALALIRLRDQFGLLPP